MQRVVGIGEVLWDRFPDGDRLGGAPANFAFHAGQLGAVGEIVSRIGTDADGARLAAALERQGLSTGYLQRDEVHPTGIVHVELRDGQPSYVIEKPAAWDKIDFTGALRDLASQVDAVCFGTLAQRDAVSRETIQKFIRLCPKQSLRLFDINLRQDYFDRSGIEFGLNHANVLKLNGGELEQLIALFGWPTRTDAAIAAVFRSYPVEWIAVTRGAEGGEIYGRQERAGEKPPPVTCVDAVGAGDAFSAALVMGLLAHRPLAAIARQANRVGSYVASRPGAMPPLPAECKTP